MNQICPLITPHQFFHTREGGLGTKWKNEKINLLIIY